MGDGFVVSTDDVETVAMYCSSVAAELTSGVSQCAADVNMLMGSWRGVASTAFGSAYGQFHSAAEQIISALSDEASDLRVVANEYVASDDALGAAVEGAV